ncbi:NDP-sugar synthase [Candidatus Bathyarchaeota archaeon]|nr:NDP-sugar synthase [Candidatus Bathyarchaeota archaeon]
MKALVLAGGFGTRLRPLSCSRPKMLFPVANQLLIDYTLQNLSRGGVDTVVLSVYYMAESLVRYLGPSKNDLGIMYSREQRPLGTGGPLKLAEDMLNGEAFLTLNGDILTDLDYRRLVSFHKEKGGLATIALVQVPDPSRYGAVELDWEGRINRFVEKPERGREPSNLINAGIYVLEPEVLKYIPEGRRVSIETEVFPRLAEERQLYGFECHGFWMDIGVPEDYLMANAMLLSQGGQAKRAATVKVDPSAMIKEPCAFGEGVEIGAESVIGPNVSMMDGVHIGKGCKIENSILFSSAVIEDYSSVRNAIIGENAVLERWVKVESGSLIGDYAQINDGVTITEGVSICPSKTIEESILVPKQVM